MDCAIQKPISSACKPSAPAGSTVLAEKILADDEHLPKDWPIHGTTGYEYLVCQNSLFINRDNEAAFTEIYSRFTGSTEDFSSLAFRSKVDVLNRMFVAEVNAVFARLKSLAASSRLSRDFTQTELRSAILNFIAGFPVYRTYVTESTQQLSSAETRAIKQGLAEAKKRTPPGEHRALDFLAQILSLDLPFDFTDEHKKDAREFVIRFQQLSGPATAKGLEDTAFYRYNRFASLNEVGGNPGRFGVTPEEFHAFNQYNAQQSPATMLSTSTHDTKRGEDTRARLNVLSEMPEAWEKAVAHWRTNNEAFRKRGRTFARRRISSLPDPRRHLDARRAPHFLHRAHAELHDQGRSRIQNAHLLVQPE